MICFRTMAEMWRNWAGVQRCDPVEIVDPQCEEDVSAAVVRAAERGQVLRAVGSGHSFTAAVLTDGVLLRMDRMSRVHHVDRVSGLVEVEAGIVLRDLNALLATHGLAMENLGDVDVQTISGAISTGTHGTGARLRNISSQVVGMRVVTGNGDVVSFDENDTELLNAARVSLGALGVVTSVKLQTVPQFTLRRSDETIDLDQALDRMLALANEHDHFEFFVFPYAKKVLAKTTDRVDEPPKPVSKAKRYFEDVLLENRAYGLVCRAGRRFPGLIPKLNRLNTAVAGGTKRQDFSHNIFATRRDVRFNEMEYSIERDAAPQAIRAVMQLVEKQRLAVNFPLEVRFVAGDDAMLSPSHQRDSCYIAVHMFQNMEYEPFFRSVESIMSEHAGRPHWGKWHFQTAETLAPRYPQWERFNEIRSRYDPQGVFANSYINSVLGKLAVGAGKS
jgi:L-gulono-1,4-lactone dehydrogenase